MIRKLAALPLVFALAGPQLTDAAEAGRIGGQILDAKGQVTHVGEAVVFLCDARTGYPIHRESKRPVEITRHDLPIDKFWYAVTDEGGSFEFNDVPVGQYRLVAQSWSGTKGMPKKIPGNTSTIVLLHGVVEDVAVKNGERTRADPRELGNGALRITNDPEARHAFLLISLKPTLGDAILGPLGWGSDFIRHAVGVSYMEKAHVTIVGLPDDRDTHVAWFAIDNNPGVGAGTYKAGQREGRLRIVAYWSNAHHEPPPELKALTDHFEANKIGLGEFVGAEARRSRRYICITFPRRMCISALSWLRLTRTSVSWSPPTSRRTLRKEKSCGEAKGLLRPRRQHVERLVR